MMTKKILIVEDEFSIALDLQQQLEELGYEVVALADSYEEALLAIAEHQPHLVLMDIHIRGSKNGIETAAKVQQLYQLPIIFLSAHADAQTFQQAIQIEPYAYLSKPFRIQDLNNAIALALTKHQQWLQSQEQIQLRWEAEQSLQSTFFIKDKGRLNAVKIGDILWLEALDNYTLVILPQAKLVYNDYLSRVHDKLPKSHFVRIHRSYVININHLSKIETDELYVGSTILPLSRSNRDELLSKIKIL